MEKLQKLPFDNREIDWRILVSGLVSPVSVTGVSETRASRSTSLVTMANRKLADNPHISTPMRPFPLIL